jgi:hypothetical protein
MDWRRVEYRKRVEHWRGRKGFGLIITSYTILKFGHKGFGFNKLNPLTLL